MCTNLDRTVAFRNIYRIFTLFSSCWGCEVAINIAKCDGAIQVSTHRCETWMWRRQCLLKFVLFLRLTCAQLSVVGLLAVLPSVGTKLNKNCSVPHPSPPPHLTTIINWNYTNCSHQSHYNTLSKLWQLLIVVQLHTFFNSTLVQFDERSTFASVQCAMCFRHLCFPRTFCS